MLADLSVVMPVFNEEGSVIEVLDELAEVLPVLAERSEIICIDDGSRDSSGILIARWCEEHPDARLIQHRANLGFGAAVRAGYREARHTFVLAVPADGQCDPSELGRLTRLAPECDLVLGYREKRPDRFYRRVKSRAFLVTARVLFGLPYRDLNWIKVVRRQALDAIELRSTGIGIDTELVYKAHRRGFRIGETHLGYRSRRFGVAKGDQPRRVAETVLELAKLRLGLLGV